MKTLLEWLAKCGKHDIKEVRVTIGDKTFEGARYKQTFNYHITMMACTHGEKKETDTYTEDIVYLVGKRPIFKRPTCFPNAADKKDWYIAGYLDDTRKITEHMRQYHPFGENFILRPWEVPSGEAIDKYETKPYNRVPIVIEEIV